ncbi:MAG: hypothetical protein HZB65_02385 [Candidatus Aenigmarchaeota archaeon]|nr:hypothetical protein [Candidatus Aenigmarchaeota archaeon]
MVEFKYKRAAATPRLIAKIDPVKDIRVRITGQVVDKMNGSVMLEDASGKAEIFMENNLVESLRIGETLRVFCRVLENNELRAELIQDMNNLDMEMYENIILNKNVS